MESKIQDLPTKWWLEDGEKGTYEVKENLALIKQCDWLCELYVELME